MRKGRGKNSHVQAETTGTTVCVDFIDKSGKNLVFMKGWKSWALHCCAAARGKIWDTFHSIIWKWSWHWRGACLCGEKLKNLKNLKIKKSIYHNKVKEKGGTCRVLGCDGTAVNTGIHNGDDYSIFWGKF